MNSLVLDIINNPGKHQVNRAEKHERTLNKMVSNLHKNERQLAEAKAERAGTSSELDQSHFGYGNKKRQGD